MVSRSSKPRGGLPIHSPISARLRATATPAVRMSWDWAPDLMKARAYEQILLGIISGELAPGLRLDEQDLTQRYSLGLAGVRDALGRLALERLVVRRPRSGTTVALLDHREMNQVFEARSLIEPHCAALAAENATNEEIHAIRVAFAGAEAAVERHDVLALVVMDQKFHAAIVWATQNPTLAHLAIPLQHKASRFWVFAMEGDTQEQKLSDIRRHRLVAECIAKRDQEGARRHMLESLGPPYSESASRRAFGGSRA